MPRRSQLSCQCSRLRPLCGRFVRICPPAWAEVEVRHHSRECRCHFGAKRHFAIASVFEGEHLFVHDLITAFASIELRRLQNGSAVFRVSVFFRHFFPSVKDVILDRHIFGIKIPHAFIWLGGKFLFVAIHCHIVAYVIFYGKINPPPWVAGLAQPDLYALYSLAVSL